MLVFDRLITIAVYAPGHDRSGKAYVEGLKTQTSRDDRPVLTWHIHDQPAKPSPCPPPILICFSLSVIFHFIASLPIQIYIHILSSFTSDLHLISRISLARSLSFIRETESFSLAPVFGYPTH